jgi:small membrane protein
MTLLIQLFLVTAFGLLLAKLIGNPRSSRIKAWKKIAIIIFILIAIFAVLFPDSSNKLANLVGVGRGADLLLYLLTTAFVFSTFNGYVTNKIEQERYVILARKIALLEAQNKYNKS